MGIGISSIRKCGCAGDFVINIDDNNVEDDTQCPICLDLIKNGDEYVLLKCSHFIHSECLYNMNMNMNLNLNKILFNCPICRAEMNEHCIVELFNCIRKNQIIFNCKPNDNKIVECSFLKRKNIKIGDQIQLIPTINKKGNNVFVCPIYYKTDHYYKPLIIKSPIVNNMDLDEGILFNTDLINDCLINCYNQENNILDGFSLSFKVDLIEQTGQLESMQIILMNMVEKYLKKNNINSTSLKYYIDKQNYPYYFRDNEQSNNLHFYVGQLDSVCYYDSEDIKIETELFQLSDYDKYLELGFQPMLFIINNEGILINRTVYIKYHNISTIRKKSSLSREFPLIINT